MVPLKPALHVQPTNTFSPELLVGQGAGVQEPVKPLAVRVMVPSKPASHWQPPWVEEELAGHTDGSQLPW